LRYFGNFRKKLPKIKSKNSPKSKKIIQKEKIRLKGENSPNLVTLAVSKSRLQNVKRKKENVCAEVEIFISDCFPSQQSDLID
jgi:hypothetical protein